jgi:predicted transcriptional regulator
MIRTAIPAVRVAVARLLKRKYNMGQQEIADRLGITQASVNKYINGDYSDRIGRNAAWVSSVGLDSKIAKLVASGRGADTVNRSIDLAASSVYTRLR